MKLEGRRADGVLLVNIGGGQSLLLNPDARIHSKPFDGTLADQYGPWEEMQHDLATRQALRKVMEASRVVPLFHLSTLTYDEKRSRVDNALREKLGLGGGGMAMPSVVGSDFWLRDLTDSDVYYQIGGRTYRRPYLESDGSVSFPGDPVEVVRNQPEWVEKRG